MLSQGFSTIHVESTIGTSEKSRKHISDAHNMNTLRGQPKTFPIHSKRDAPPLAMPIATDDVDDTEYTPAVAATDREQCTSVSSSSAGFANCASSALVTITQSEVMEKPFCSEPDNENTSDAQSLAQSTHGLPLTKAHSMAATIFTEML